MSRKKFDEDSWYVNLIMGFVVLITAFFINRGYNDFLSQRPGDISGKGGKFGVLVLKKLDIMGGKPLVFGVLIGIALLCFYWAYRKYKKSHQ